MIGAESLSKYVQNDMLKSLRQDVISMLRGQRYSKASGNAKTLIEIQKERTAFDANQK